MKDGTPAWSVVVVAINKHDRILAIARNFNSRNPALPGGDSIESDTQPARTAKRELFEETGVTALALRCIDRWEGDRGQPVYVFFAEQWKGAHLRTSNEGKPFWTTPETLFRKTATYGVEARRILDKLNPAANR